MIAPRKQAAFVYRASASDIPIWNVRGGEASIGRQHHGGSRGLTQVISGLRRVLGDDRNGPRLIATVSGRGYQFVGHVRAATYDEPAPARRGPAAHGVIRDDGGTTGASYVSSKGLLLCE